MLGYKNIAVMCCLLYAGLGYSSHSFVLQAGGFWSTQGKMQHIYIEEIIGDTFTVSKQHDSNGLVGLSYLVRGPNLGRIQMHYGLNAFYLPKVSVLGTVIQEDLFTNLSYKYNITNYPLYLSAKSIIPLAEPVALTLDVGIGSNFMRTDRFKEYSLDDGITIPDDIFKSRTTATYSATAGIGVQLTNLFGTVPLECGYRFFYLDRGHLKRTSDFVLNDLSTGTVYANAAVCSVRI